MCYDIEIEDSIKFLEEAKDRLKGHHDAIFLLEISQSEKQLSLGLHHDCIEHLNKIRSDVNAHADIDAKVYAGMAYVYGLYYQRK